MKSIIIVVVSATLFISCGGSTVGVDALALEQEQMKQQVDGIAQQVTELNSSVSRLTNQVSALRNDASGVTSQLEDLARRISLSEETIRTYSSYSATTDISMMDLPPSISHEDFELRYSQARELFESEQYQDAIPIFEQLINQGPDDNLADNSQFWIGECYYGLKKYDQSLLEFEKVFTFTNSNKTDDAQLKIAFCYLRLNNATKAREEFQRVLDYYPDSEYVAIARNYVGRL